MPEFSDRSKSKLITCHVDIQIVLNEAIKYIDFMIDCGVRTLEDQQEMFRTGRSKCDGIDKISKHQIKPDGYSHAVDIAPYPLDYSDDNKKKARFYFLMGVVEGICKKLHNDGLILSTFRYGLDWDNDRDFSDQSFDDLPHLELRS